jgi:hypothetical protein
MFVYSRACSILRFEFNFIGRSQCNQHRQPPSVIITVPMCNGLYATMCATYFLFLGLCFIRYAAKYSTGSSGLLDEQISFIKSDANKVFSQPGFHEVRQALQKYWDNCLIQICSDW